MFDERKYMQGYCHYFVNGVVNLHKDSRVIWWGAERYQKGKRETIKSLEHSAVVIADGVYLDARGVFMDDGEREADFGELSGETEGTVDHFKAYLRQIRRTYGDRNEQSSVGRLLRLYRPVIAIQTKNGIAQFSIEDWNIDCNILRVHLLTTNNGLYVYNRDKVQARTSNTGEAVLKSDMTISVEFLKKYMTESIGWRPIYHTIVEAIRNRTVVDSNV